MLAESFPFWNHLTPEEQHLLEENTRPVSYKAGTMIHGGSGNCTGGILVKSGCIRAYLLSEEGREITLYRLYPNDICMLSASCVLQSITFDVFVDAEEDSDVCIINGQTFLDLSNQNIYVENFALQTAVERFSDVIWVMQQILFMSLDKRLAVFLLDESAKNGKDSICLTQEQIAKYMGSAREAVSRMLKYFSTEKLVSIQRGSITILDRKRLQEMVSK